MGVTTPVASFRGWWGRPDVQDGRIGLGAIVMALLGLGLFASGAMGAASYFADDPFWFDALLIAGACEVAAAVLCTTRRSRRLAFLGLLPSLAVAGFVIAQAGDPNLLVGDLLLALVVLT